MLEGSIEPVASLPVDLPVGGLPGRPNGEINASEEIRVPVQHKQGLDDSDWARDVETAGGKEAQAAQAQ